MNNYQTWILLHPKFRLARLLNSFYYGCQFNVMELPKKQQTSKQASNQEFFRTPEFSSNQVTSINNHLQHKKERPHREKSKVFSPGNSLKFNPWMTAIRIFFENQGTFFQFLKKDRGDLPPFLPLVTRLQNMVLIIIKLCLIFLRFHIRVIYHWLIFLACPCFQHYSSLFFKLISPVIKIKFIQRHIQNLDKYLRQSFFRKQLTAKSR